MKERGVTEAETAATVEVACWSLIASPLVAEIAATVEVAWSVSRTRAASPLVVDVAGMVPLAGRSLTASPVVAETAATVEVAW